MRLASNEMESKHRLDKYRLREIEQQLAAEIQTTAEQLRSASTEEEKRIASEAHSRALKRFSDFAGKGIVPEEFLGSHGA